MFLPLLGMSNTDLLEWVRMLEHLKDAHDVDLAGIMEWTDPQAEADKLKVEHCGKECRQ